MILMQRCTFSCFFLGGIHGAPRSRVSHVMDGIAMYLYNNTTHFKDFIRDVNNIQLYQKVDSFGHCE